MSKLHMKCSAFFGLSVLGFVMANEPASAQVFDRVLHVRSASSNGVAMDSNGNTYTTGTFIGRVDFDPGPGVFELFSPRPSQGNGGAVFLSKFDSAGHFVWARKKDIPGYDQASDIAIDSNGNAVMTGYLNWTGSTGTLYVTKYDPDGSIVWNRNIANATGMSIAIDSQDNVYTTGNFLGTVDFDPGAGTYELTSDYQTNMFISKLDSGGNFVWARAVRNAFQDVGFEDPRGIAVDANQNVFVAGRFWNRVDFDPGPATFVLASKRSEPLRPDYDIFVLKLDSAGNFGWAKQMGGIFFDEAKGIAVDSEGSVITTGTYNGNAPDADFNPGVDQAILGGGIDTFISKLSNDGNFIWVRRLGTPRIDEAFDVAVDGANNIYTTGVFTDASHAAGAGDIFISKRGSNGSLVWTGKVKGSGFGVGNAISVDDSGNVAVAGDFRGNLDFDPSATQHYVTSSAYAYFLLKVH